MKIPANNELEGPGSVRSAEDAAVLTPIAEREEKFDG
jgi:hypothetical protein